MMAIDHDLDAAAALLRVKGVEDTVNGTPIPVLLVKAANEMRFLRLAAGAISQGEDVADLKRRQGPQDVNAE